MLRTNSHHQTKQGITPALSNMDIMRIAPSVFAEDKHGSRSDRYSYIPSSEILVALRNEGFEPYFAKQSRSRIEGKSEFTKHMLRFRHRKDLERQAVVNDTVNEVIMVNSHDGTSKINLFGGVFRYVCANGLMVGESTAEQVSFTHSGTTLDNVIEGAYTVLDEFEYVEHLKQTMMETMLSDQERRALGLQSLSLKFDMDDFRPSAIDILTPRRQEDNTRDLWTTFNVVQENILRGGVPKTVNPPQNGRRGTTRETTNITDSVKLNKGLWSLAQAMAFANDDLI